MKIYHYTTIETLALILEHKTLRFNNAQNVDDLDEAETVDFGSFKNYVFVSCWTSDSRENVALWNMYSHGMRGVRICVDDSKIEYNGSRSWDEDGSIRHIHVVENVRPENASSIVINWGSWGGETQDYKNRIEIDYDNREARTFSKHYGSNTSVLYIENIVGRKENWWRFQNEVRFALLACTDSDAQRVGANFPEDSVITNISEKVPFECKYVDLLLGSSFFKNIEVMSGPKTTEAERLVINALLEKYLPEKSYDFSKSSLNIRKES